MACARVGRFFDGEARSACNSAAIEFRSFLAIENHRVHRIGQRIFFSGQLHRDRFASRQFLFKGCIHGVFSFLRPGLRDSAGHL